MIRFVTYAFPLILLLLALFGFVVEVLDLEPRSGAVIRLALFEQPRVPGAVVLGAWIMETCGLLALFLLAQGRCGAWWLDGLVAGWLAWVFRGPLLVLTVVVAARQPQDPWWDIAFGWWILYSICGLALAILARRSGVVFALEPDVDANADVDDEREPAAELTGEPQEAVELPSSEAATPSVPDHEHAEESADPSQEEASSKDEAPSEDLMAEDEENGQSAAVQDGESEEESAGDDRRPAAD